MDLITDPEKRSYDELKLRLAYHRKRFPCRKIWELINSNPIEIKTIDKLIGEGWSILINRIESYCNYIEQEIGIWNGLPPYCRDKVLFHEIAHAAYGEELADVFGSVFDHDNRVLAEVLARESRADPELLGHTINAFNLTPYIYDFVSYRAFSSSVNLDSQIPFLFARENHISLSKTLLD